MGHFATGITVVVTQLDSGFHGMTVNSFTSVSLQPPLVLFCVDNKSQTLAALKTSPRFTVSILSASQEKIGRQFAKLGPQAELFKSLPVKRTSNGLLVLSQGLAYLSGQMTSLIPAGDHHIILGEVDELGTLDAEAPALLYFKGTYESL